MGRNWDWSFAKGKERRLQAEQACHTSGQPVPPPPLHSHDGTMQSMFENGWHSVTPVEIQRAISPPPRIGEALRNNQRLRDLLRIAP
ncbi:hypothetical protein [Alkalimonas mucilaginosa]|uniref:Uncharacterized protein n=1 Tax=Alkalimonas mucilaginosa TaxID=3057676 RepID=A0ABU7JH90_9GAMM|nr:hypothetical protein [Alkalimonas sp. MEB004]MEE2025046.1 hypothetical protein [Alkalimonas sp. MEB004]